jgi:hypothetical protein
MSFGKLAFTPLVKKLQELYGRSLRKFSKPRLFPNSQTLSGGVNCTRWCYRNRQWRWLSGATVEILALPMGRWLAKGPLGL